MAERLGRDGDDLAVRFTSRNTGEGVDAFHADWTGEESVSSHVGDLAEAARLVGVALLAAAVVVLAYKLGIIAALIGLLVRLVTASILPGGAVAAVVAERAVLNRLRNKIVELLQRVVGRPFARAAERLGRPLIRTPRRWPAHLLRDRTQAAADRSFDPDDIVPRDVVWRTERRILGRYDSRGPDRIFEEGFQPQGDELDLHEFIHGHPGGFVSTSRDINLIVRARHNGFYRYLVDVPGGIDVRRSARVNTYLRPIRTEREVAVPGGIDRRYIVGAQRYRGGGMFDPFIPNPHYSPEG
ncbi:hypothetical protein FHR32_002219 [Streptosporangium album]|uniref:Pierisin-like domain-containing protein n=1 Tax=Streptosporangium album TaxID=47479 RepID=A0A7W7RTH9_9ACTN|nr:hypothetical protein [Streptosporangium album]MBB4937914.1 hypothetical protein [Streptosporangium album]